jgi:hypothetical protein
LLAHVLTHEIVHMWQGTDQHSSSGLMKSAWDQRDYGRMVKAGLELDASTVVSIKTGLAARRDYNRSETRSGFVGRP